MKRTDWTQQGLAGAVHLARDRAGRLGDRQGAPDARDHAGGAGHARGDRHALRARRRHRPHARAARADRGGDPRARRALGRLRAPARAARRGDPAARAGSSAWPRASRCSRARWAPAAPTGWRSSGAASGSTRRSSTRCSRFRDDAALLAPARGPARRAAARALGAGGPRAAAPTTAAGPRRRGVRPRDRRQVALHRPPLGRRRRLRDRDRRGDGRRATGLRDLRRAGLLHDIGKLAVSSRILDKPGKLTDEEFAAMKEHTRFTLQILERVACFRDLAGIAASHHERLDGSRLPPRAGGVRPPAPGAHPRRGRHLRGADRRPAVPGGDAERPGARRSCSSSAAPRCARRPSTACRPRSVASRGSSRRSPSPPPWSGPAQAARAH